MLWVSVFPYKVLRFHHWFCAKSLICSWRLRMEECFHLLHYRKEYTLTHISKQFGAKLITASRNIITENSWISVSGCARTPFLCSVGVRLILHSVCGWLLTEGECIISVAADSGGRDGEAVLSLPLAEVQAELVGLQRMQKATQPVLLPTPPPTARLRWRVTELAFTWALHINKAVPETKHAFTWPRLQGARQNGCSFFPLSLWK